MTWGPMRATEPLSLPDEMFARLIEGTLAGDRLRQLEAHCDGCEACGRAMAELARTITPARGDWLGERYRILEPLAAGGMGVVYTAFDTKLQRKVAIKRLRETAGGPTAERRRTRFLREAQMLASLSHPNVLTVHDVGAIDRELYVVMELVDGWPMSRWISEAQPRPGWPQIVDMYLQVGRGLSAAHQLGVIHRDVKPENILVGRSGRVLIGDFGLAGLTDARAASTDACRRALGADADRERCWARPRTWRPSCTTASRATCCRISSRSVCRCTNRCTAAGRFVARPPPISPRRCAPVRRRPAPTAYRARSIACSRPASPPIRRGGTCRWTRC